MTNYEINQAMIIINNLFQKTCTFVSLFLLRYFFDIVNKNSFNFKIVLFLK